MRKFLLIVLLLLRFDYIFSLGSAPLEPYVEVKRVEFPRASDYNLSRYDDWMRYQKRWEEAADCKILEIKKCKNMVPKNPTNTNVSNLNASLHETFHWILPFWRWFSVKKAFILGICVQNVSVAEYIWLLLMELYRIAQGYCLRVCKGLCVEFQEYHSERWRSLCTMSGFFRPVLDCVFNFLSEIGCLNGVIVNYDLTPVARLFQDNIFINTCGPKISLLSFLMSVGDLGCVMFVFGKGALVSQSVIEIADRRLKKISAKGLAYTSLYFTTLRVRNWLAQKLETARCIANAPEKDVEMRE